MERPLPVFDPVGPAFEVSVRWKKWLRAFNYFAEGEGLRQCGKEKEQNATFGRDESSGYF